MIGIRAHFILRFLCSAVGMIAGVFGAVIGFASAAQAEWGIAFLGVAVLVLGLLLPHHVFSNFIPARCPKCSGPAYPQRLKRIRFVCRKCGHCHQTNWTFGSRGPGRGIES